VVELGCIAQYSITSWHHPHLGFLINLVLTTFFTVLAQNLKLYQICICLDRAYKELVSAYENPEKIFTDGSKKGSAVSAAAVMCGKVLVKRLPARSFINFVSRVKSTPSGC
jgi:hypothetical protein